MNDNILTREQIYEDIRNKGGKAISYSQISMFNFCQYQWKLKYIDKIKEVEKGSIYLIFGSAMHTVLQTYLKKMFDNTALEADAMDLEKILLEEMKTEFINTSNSLNDTTFTNKDEMINFYEDGAEILKFFAKKRKDYFQKQNKKLLGIEIPIYAQLDCHPKVFLVGFIDVGIQDLATKEITLYDFKTSTMGWKKEKKDFSKLAQLILYKKYFSKQFGVDPKLINVQFFILKRKLFAVSEFPQKRIQIVEPASGTIKMKETEKMVENFVNYVWDENAEIKPNLEFKKLADNKLCKYCDFYKTVHCKWK